MSWPSNNQPAKQSELTDPPIKNDRPGGESLPVLGENANGSTPTLQGPRGINNALFAERMKDRDGRLDRLETAVQSLRNDFDSIQPSITRLVGLEGDIQQLVTQLETLLAEESEPAAAPSQAMKQGAMPMQGVNDVATASNDASEAAQAPPKVIHPQPVMEEPSPQPVKQTQAPKASGATQVVNIRIGEHPDKTRIVLDMNGKSEFTYDLDNQEKILIVDLQSAKWSAMAQKTFSSDSPLLQSFRTEPSENGTLLILQLKQASSVIYAKEMEGAVPSQKRIVIDVAVDMSASATQ